MTTDLIASLIDSIITIVAGSYILLARPSLVARIADPRKKARVDTILRVCAPIMIVGALLLAASKIGNHEDDLSKLVRQTNETLPKLIEPGTRLERITVGEPRRLIYHLTSLPGLAKDVDWVAWRQQKIKMEEQIRQGSDAKKLLRAGITLVYRYSDRDAVLIDQIIVTPATSDPK